MDSIEWNRIDLLLEFENIYPPQMISQRTSVIHEINQAFVDPLGLSEWSAGNLRETILYSFAPEHPLSIL